MSITALDATAAYGRARGIVNGAAADGDGAAVATPAGGFGAMIEHMVGAATTNLKAAEAASIRQVAGKGDLIDVVTAMGAAETALDTVVAVRDRVVNAYSEIMRMQV